MGLQQTLKALADPIRREILNMLKNGRMSAGEITDHFYVTGASISRHLSVLKEADLVRDRREGQHIFYELNASVIEEIMLWITDLKGENENAQEKQEKADNILGNNSFANSIRSDFLERSSGENADPLGN